MITYIGNQNSTVYKQRKIRHNNSVAEIMRENRFLPGILYPAKPSLALYTLLPIPFYIVPFLNIKFKVFEDV